MQSHITSSSSRILIRVLGVKVLTLVTHKYTDFRKNNTLPSRFCSVLFCSCPVAASPPSVCINSRYGYGSNNPPESCFGQDCHKSWRTGEEHRLPFLLWEHVELTRAREHRLREEWKELVEHNVPWCRASGRAAAAACLFCCQLCHRCRT